MYSHSYYRSRESWPDFRLEADALLRLARLCPAARVLEVGCGSGGLLRRMGQRARLAVGVDLSWEGLSLARDRVGGSKELGAGAGFVLRARAESLPFANGAFDAVVAQHLLEHLPDPVQALQEWRRVLCPEGILVLITPNASYPDGDLFHDPDHINLFTPASLRTALEDAGFRVTHLATLFPYLGRHRLARSASIRLGRLQLGLRLPGLGNGRSLLAAATPSI